MKSIYLLRHAKSDWSTEHATDHERPLSKRGRRAAATIGSFLADVEQEPEAVVSSTAVRARTTVELAAQAGGWSCPVRLEAELYGASMAQLLAAIKTAPDEADRLLLAGHEPTFSTAVGQLIGGGSVRMVTAALARIDLSVKRWEQADFGLGTLVWLVTPKLLQRYSG